jgi:hypothetical protein
VSDNPSPFITTTADLDRAIARFDAGERPPATPAPQPATPAADDPYAAIRAEGAAAAAAERERSETLDAARATLWARGRAEGFTIDTSSLSDEETLAAVGIYENEDPRRRSERERIERENNLTGDELAAEERKRDLARLSGRWFQMSLEERKTAAVALGIDGDAAEFEKQAEMKARRS